MAIKKETINQLARLLKGVEITPLHEKGNARIIEMVCPPENVGTICNILWEIKWSDRDVKWKGKHDDDK